MRKYHVIVTTYDTVKSEYMAYSPSAKDASKASSKKKASKDDDDDDSESDSFGKKAVKKKGKAAKKCALYDTKWWRVVLGIFSSLFLVGFVGLRTSKCRRGPQYQECQDQGGYCLL